MIQHSQKLESKFAKPIHALTAIVLVLGVWWMLTSVGHVFNATLLPSPGTVYRAFVSLSANGTLPEDIITSLRRVVEGFGISVACALPLASVMAFSKTVENMVSPLIELVRPVPPLAVIPLSILWFGIGESSKLFIIAYGAFFPLIVNFRAGFKQIDMQLVRATQSLGASRFQSFWHVNIHSALEHIVVGMRLGMGMAFLVLVGAELIAASSGLGYLIVDAQNRFRSDQMVVGIITIGVLGFFLNAILLKLESILVPWRKQVVSR